MIKGSPFTNPTGTLPAADAHNIKILDQGLNVLFSTPFTSQTWHNFAVVIDWDALTLEVFYSTDAQALKVVSPTKDNPGAMLAPDGQGEFHFGLLKVHYLCFHEIVSTDENLKIVALGYPFRLCRESRRCGSPRYPGRNYRGSDLFWSLD